MVDSDGGVNSIFTRAFLNTLTENDGVVHGERLHAKIYEQVRYSADQLNFDQHPQYSAIADAGDKNGQFVFIPKSMYDRS